MTRVLDYREPLVVAFDRYPRGLGGGLPLKAIDVAQSTIKFAFAIGSFSIPLLQPIFEGIFISRKKGKPQADDDGKDSGGNQDSEKLRKATKTES
jgi:hypothetical protein